MASMGMMGSGVRYQTLAAWAREVAAEMGRSRWSGEVLKVEGGVEDGH